jgi:lysozyme family protein
MADFKTAVAKTLVHEGGYVNNPADRGGPTNFGITQADMPGVDMRTITQDQAVAYYQEHYWKPLYSEISNQDIADKLFDVGVLFGVGTAVKILQTSMESEIHVVSDGDFGPETLADVNQYGDIGTYKTALIQHVINIVHNNPSQNVFANGWIHRVNS